MPVYVIAISLLLGFLLIGWIARENYEHSKELRMQQKQTNRFLRREVCVRLQFRDEVFGTVLEATAAKYAFTDPKLADVYLQALAALRFSTKTCLAQLPE
jgi:hypothetical protein